MKKLIIAITLALIFPIIGYCQVNWISQNSGTTSSLDGVYFVDENNGWIAGWGGIILHTTNGGNTWGLQNTPVTSLSCIFFTDSQSGWASGLGGDVVHTTNGGETWLMQDNLDYQDIFKLYFINGNNGWAAGGFFDYLSGSYGRAIYNTTNGGVNWNVQYDVTFETELHSIYFIDGSTGYAAGGTAVMKTTNGGSNWFVQQTFSSFSLKDIVFTNNTTGFVTAYYVGVPHYTSIFKTTDSGSSWNEISLGTNEDLSGLYFTDELNGWAVGNDYSSGNSLALIYRTTDGGNTWVKQNIPSFDALSEVFFVNATKGWAVGSLGTILTTEITTPVELISFTAETDNNNVVLNWKTATETNNSGFEILRSGQNENNWGQIGFVEGRGTTTNESNYSFTDRDLSTGNYEYKLKQIDYDGSFQYSNVVDITISEPTEFTLSQNYPNPFNPSTAIQYSIPESGNVKLKVFNSIGEEVATLVNNYKEAGSYKVTFNANGLSSGIYYYKLSSNGFNQVKKMILLK
jgi:photosystem II stability/assembly factor-like uncharacterized protein